MIETCSYVDSECKYYISINVFVFFVYRNKINVKWKKL